MGGGQNRGKMNEQGKTWQPVMGRSLKVAVALLSAGLGVVVALGEPPTGSGDARLRAHERLEGLMDQEQWATKYQFLQRAINNVWEQNRWTSEADWFAQSVARRVAAIPPWRPLDRVRVVTQQVEKRYALSGEDAARFRSLAVEEGVRFLTLHSATILGQTSDWIIMRAEGKALDRAVVARWAQRGEAMVSDLGTRAERLAAELGPLVRPHKRKMLERDLRSFRKRQRHLEFMRMRWAEGEWGPEDWGLQDDPIQNPDAPDRSAGGQRWIPHRPTTWAAYMSHIQAVYRLDPGQVDSAQSIHEELFRRAQRYTNAYAHVLHAVPQSERAQHGPSARRQIAQPPARPHVRSPGHPLVH